MKGYKLQWNQYLNGVGGVLTEDMSYNVEDVALHAENKHVIIINGVGGVGKDELIKRFKVLIPHHSLITNLSTIDKVKQAAIALGWDYDDKCDENRKALSELKEFWDNHWGGSIEWVEKMYSNFKRSERKWLFLHCREPENIAKIVELIPDAKAVLITREGIESHGNPSDDNVTNYNYDLVFNNDKDIIDSGRLFAMQIYALFGENPRELSEQFTCIETNLDGKKFFDYGNYGLGDFTILKCLRKYACHNDLPPMGTWESVLEIEIELEDGRIRRIPFCPYWEITEAGSNKKFSDFYNEQPW